MAQAPGSVDPDTIFLDLEPDETQKGELHGSNRTEYLALETYQSLYHFAITPEAKVHGYYVDADGQKTAASLLILNVVAVAERFARPIRWASVEVTFEKSGGKDDDIDDCPAVERLAPGRPELRIQCTETWTTKTKREIQAGVSGGAYGASANLGLNSGKEKEVAREVEYSTSINAFSTRSDDDRDVANRARWIFKTISNVHSIPPDMSLGILLMRPDDGDCVFKVEVHVELHGTQSVGEILSHITKWNKKTPKFHQLPKTDIKKGGLDVDFDKLISGKQKAMNELVYELIEAKKPQLYKQYQQEEVKDK
jgi:hypothetical protein